ncbi:MAG: NAD(P)-binding domain-containing protein [Paludibacteraceae bacterium]|nr:NAD(P)-binding domain-containing protein [Paludibacteraceae bacterium]
MNIAFTTPLPAEGFERLRGYNLNAEPETAEVLVSTFDKQVTREMIAAMPRLRLIANFGVGYNNIDLSACKERGITVTNTPQPVIEPTAELAFALMICVARRVAEFDRQLREGTCQPMAVMNNLSHGLYGKTLGIIGMGRIGQALARRALASGMKVVYHNRHELQCKVYGVQCTGVAPEPDREWQADVIKQARYLPLEVLLQEADFVSLNLPYKPETHHLIGSPQLQLMKPTAYLINTARGAHVDEAALIRALKAGQIAGAAMDVYEHEPQISEELLEMPNVVLSPHTGTGTWEGRIAMCENVCDNILAFADGQLDNMDIVQI